MNIKNLIELKDSFERVLWEKENNGRIEDYEIDLIPDDLKMNIQIKKPTKAKAISFSLQIASSLPSKAA